ncbi:MAG: cell wall-binding repeat-containing protein [Eubacteriales bacterium]
MKIENKAKSVMIIVLVALLILPFYSKPVEAAYSNPTIEETAKKIEKIAIEKKIPPEILKAIAYHESGWRQFDNYGNPVIGAGKYIGIMQIGSYSSADTYTVNKLKYDIDFNIAYGADMLNAKWDMVPKIGDGDKSKLENWYFAIWAYNSWSTRNNPNNSSSTYQSKIYNLISQDYYQGVVNPVKITPVPACQIPSGTVPSSSGNWQTPEPVHYAVFSAENEAAEAAKMAELLKDFTRISGADRIETVVQIALEGWSNGCETVIISKADDFPDALAGVPLAAKNNAPILLTGSDELDVRVSDALAKLKPLKVILLGGQGALSEKVEQDIKKVVYWTDDIERIAGSNRYETAALIAARFPLDKGVAIATGEDFPDALSLASAAASSGYPLLLVKKDEIPYETKQILQKLCPRNIIAAGGEAVISENVMNQIYQISGLGEKNVNRIAGSDRYETAALIVKENYSDISELYLVSGFDFPDALAGAALAAKTKSPMLLVPSDGVKSGSDLENYLLSLSEKVDVKVFGGNQAVTDKSLLSLKNILDRSKI